VKLKNFVTKLREQSILVQSHALFAMLVYKKDSATNQRPITTTN